MAENESRTRKKPRIRASKACIRCSQRKVLCEGADPGGVCNRCKRDHITECIFTPTRRGRYPRRKSTLESVQAPQLSPEIVNDQRHEALRSQNNNTNPSSNENNPQSGSPTDHDGSQPTEGPVSGSVAQTRLRRESDIPPDACYAAQASPGQELVRLRKMPNHLYGDRGSLAAMFEAFLERQDTDWDRTIGRCGIIFQGESSPLTFALKEFEKGVKPRLHNASVSIPHREGSDTDTPGDRDRTHPNHLQQPELRYLKDKSAFDLPKPDVLESLVSAFLDRFVPLYSIVNRAEFELTYRKGKLPWILMHAVCFIGASYCDQSTIHLSGFKSRWHARRTFFDKAKILFDVGYETNKIVLLQVVLMLSFWGPHMKSYWNPCSWIGFAVTIAESLGIHQSTTLANLGSKDKGLLRRLWWTLASRDAYCAALLGRPFRINTSQCDTEELSLDDFDGASSDSAPIESMYQIQIAKLYLISRQIVQSSFGSTAYPTSTEALYQMLDRWLAELPAIANWRHEYNKKNVFAISLKIIYHHQLILIYLGKQSKASGTQETLPDRCTAADTAESAARMILSTSLTLITNSMVDLLPHEVFSGFFIAGIMFYRQIRQQSNMLAQLGRAALDNCQMIIHEAREHWDASQWVLRIFEFLLSSTENLEQTSDLDYSTSTPMEPFPEATFPGSNDGLPPLTHMPFEDSGGILHHIEMDSPYNQDLMKNFNDFLLMPGNIGPLIGSGFNFQF